MSQTITNSIPRARFQTSADNIKKHRDLVDSPEFIRASDFAVAQYAGECTVGLGTAADAVAAGYKIQGAMEFLQTFRMLSESPTAPKNVPTPSLNHRV